MALDSVSPSNCQDKPLALDLVSEHLSSNVATANKLACSCSSLREVGTISRNKFVTEHNALLDRLGQEVDTFRLKLWLDDYYSYADNYQFYIPSWTTSDDRDKYTSDFYDKTFSLRRVDSDVFQRLESFHSLDNQHKYIEYIHAIVDGLNTPHQDVALYKRCLKTINDFVDFAHKNNDNLTEVTIEGYIRVWLTEGAFSGILSIVQKFVAGSLVDKMFFDAVINFFGLFNMYHDTRIIYVAHNYLGDNNLLVLIADFFRHEFAQECNNDFNQLFMSIFNPIQHLSYHYEPSPVIELPQPWQIDDFKLYYHALKLYMQLDRESYPVFGEELDIDEYLLTVEKHILTNICS